MKINVFESKRALGEAAANKAAELLIQAIQTKGNARFIVATGASQFEFLHALVNRTDVEWEKTEKDKPQEPDPQTRLLQLP